MNLQSALLPILIGIFAYALAFLTRILFPDWQIQDIRFLPAVMYLAVAAGLYLNVSDIERKELPNNKWSIAAVLLFGVPAKILIPGLLLSVFLPTLGKAAVFLCATVIAQIDPILAAKSIAHDRFSTKSSTILRCWSSFDDPITVLFAFYIFLPLFFREQSSSLIRYLIEVSVELAVCLLLAALFKIRIKMRNRWSIFSDRKFRKIIVIATCVVSGLSGRFLLPASLGLVVRPFKARTKEFTLNFIFGLSAFVIGALAADIPLNWLAGGFLGAAMFFIAQPLVAFCFIRDSKKDRLRVMFGHQNGMTAILLTIALELRIDKIGDNQQLLSITLPAIILITVFYSLVNYWLEQHYFSLEK